MFPIQNVSPVWSLIFLVDLILKGFACWFAAKRDQKYWFIAIFVINTAGILPLFYLYRIGELQKFLRRFGLFKNI